MFFMKMELYLKRRFSENRVCIKTHILTTKDLKTIVPPSHSVLVISKYLVNSLAPFISYATSSTIVRVTIEMSSQDMNNIADAINFHERQIFQEFLHKTEKTSS